MHGSFAVADDVAARWRPLTPDESARADVLAEDASDMIRARYPDVDTRVTAGGITEQTLIRVVAGMVKRAMLNGAVEGVTQQSQGAGPFSLGQTFANPNGNLYLSADDISAIEGASTKGRAASRWLA